MFLLWTRCMNLLYLVGITPCTNSHLDFQRLESSLVESLGVLVDNEMGTSQQCTLVANKTIRNH